MSDSSEGEDTISEDNSAKKYTCGLCNKSFASEKNLNIHKSKTHGFDVCSYCRKPLEEVLSFTCKFCGKKFCTDHRLPENHECEKLGEEKEMFKKGKKPMFPRKGKKIKKTERKPSSVPTSSFDSKSSGEPEREPDNNDSSKNNEIWNNINYWFKSQDQFFMNILYLIILLLSSFIIYNNLSTINQIEFFIFRIGSIIILVLFFFVFRYVYYISKQLKYKYRRLKKHQKFIAPALLLAILAYVYLNQETIIPKMVQSLGSFSFPNLNPIILSKLTFIPSPWRSFLIYGTIIFATIFLLKRYVFKRKIPTWFYIVSILALIIFAFQFHVPYKKTKIDSLGTYCKEGKVLTENNFIGLGSLAVSSNCMEYKSSQCNPICVNNKPFCQCEAVPIDLIFSQPGSWFLEFR